MVQNQVKQVETLLNEIDQLTIGWNTDSQANNTYLETTLTAVAGTKTARFAPGRLLIDLRPWRAAGYSQSA